MFSNLRMSFLCWRAHTFIYITRIHVDMLAELLISVCLTLQTGQAIYVGGLVRLDLSQASVETIYVTVWASSNISLHMGKIENAEETWRKHVGVRLQVFAPQIG